VHLHWVTLHVGPGTFLPVTAEKIEEHVMHGERGEIAPATAEAINAARAAGGRVIAVGTTVIRLLESAADEAGRIRPFEGETALFIRPGYSVRAVDGLMTNFHLPRSTLLMLVSALMGRERMLSLYAHAVRGRYRFYSYGDSSLLVP
jgi:S-adenosylmethionine:tRNA ribosyltransferase-isomerase